MIANFFIQKIPIELNNLTRVGQISFIEFLKSNPVTDHKHHAKEEVCVLTKLDFYKSIKKFLSLSRFISNRGEQWLKGDQSSTC